MARTILEIYDAKVAEMQTQSYLNTLQPQIDSAQQLLSDLTTPSKVANWRMLLFLTSVFDWLGEVAMDQFLAEVNAIVEAAIPGTAQWLVKEAKAFQYGYQLQWISNKFQYSVVDETAKIVKRAAVVESGGQAIIKVAKESGSAVVPLTSAELSAFTAYVNQIKYAGVSTSVISNTADDLKVNYNIYYDPLVLTSTGELISSPGVKPVEDAVNDYLTALPFNGVLDLNDVTDEVQEAEGVVSPFLLSAQAKFGANPYAAIGDRYLADAGYIQLDLANCIFTYIPNV
jgi:hypothetical protein